MKFLILGCGSIGRRHARNLIGLGYTEIIGCDVNEECLKRIKEESKIKTSSSFDESLDEADIVLICTPNHLHSKFALASLKADKHVFVEKPIADKIEGLDAMEKIAEEKNRILFVGFNFRFHPLLNQIKRFLESNEIGNIYGARVEFGSYFPNWRLGQDYSQNFGAKKSEGGGVILDDVHEIDYILWLFGGIESVFCHAHKISDLKIDTEDNADILLRTKAGFFINLHMDYLQLEPYRRIRIVGSQGIIEGDLVKNKLSIFKSGKWEEYQEDFDHNKTYIDEINEFLRCVGENRTPCPGFKEGVDSLKVALAAKQSAEQNKVVFL